MKCGKCGEEIIDVKKPCSNCGHVMTEQEDMNSIIKNILEEDDYKPKFESKDHVVVVDKKGSASKNHDKVAGKPKESNGHKQPKKTEAVSKAKSPKKAEPLPKKQSLSDIIVHGLRYVLAGLIVLFTISLFFDWISLSGNAVNQGISRSEEIKPFIQEGIKEHSIESLESYEGPIITFSAMDLYKFSDSIGDDYMMVVGPGGQENKSLVAMVQKYYMKAIMVMIIINVISLIIVLVFRSLKGISIVRNFSVLNFVIIGLNYLALKVPYFSMIAVKAKDGLGQSMEHPEIAMTHNGITLNQSFYPYTVTEERGLIIALIVLGLWLIVGIILSEVKSRREEIAIEKGEF